MPLTGRVAAAARPLVEALNPVLRTRDERSMHDPDAAARSLAYGYTTPRLISELWHMVRLARRQLHVVESPTLIVHSREDNRVPPREVFRAVRNVTHAEMALHWVSGCGHVLTADYCKDAVATLVIDWFERCTAMQGAPTHAR
jgi:carboxylesterase